MDNRFMHISVDNRKKEMVIARLDGCETIKNYPMSSLLLLFLSTDNFLYQRLQLFLHCMNIIIYSALCIFTIKINVLNIVL